MGIESRQSPKPPICTIVDAFMKTWHSRNHPLGSGPKTPSRPKHTHLTLQRALNLRECSVKICSTEDRYFARFDWFLVGSFANSIVTSADQQDSRCSGRAMILGFQAEGGPLTRGTNSACLTKTRLF